MLRPRYHWLIALYDRAYRLCHRLDTPSMKRFTDTPMWNRHAAELSWRYYLGAHADDVPQYAAPARAIDLAGLPPTYVSVMEFDPLRDEGIAYATRLLEAEVPVELHLYPGTFHGSSLIVNAEAPASSSFGRRFG